MGVRFIITMLTGGLLSLALLTMLAYNLWAYVPPNVNSTNGELVQNSSGGGPVCELPYDVMDSIGWVSTLVSLGTRSNIECAQAPALLEPPPVYIEYDRIKKQDLLRRNGAYPNLTCLYTRVYYPRDNRIRFHGQWYPLELSTVLNRGALPSEDTSEEAKTKFVAVTCQDQNDVNDVANVSYVLIYEYFPPILDSGL